MNITGIIAEYNPFHNGHIYHINKAKELTNPDLIICVLSGNFSQRGDVSVMDKFEKTKYALDNGVDLVVELPYLYTTQNAYIFSKKAIEILNKLKVNNIVFGSETNNLNELKKYAELEVDVTRLKELLNKGESYPKAYGLLSGSMYPNDILAVTYLKSLKNTKIIPYSIQRTNDYHSKNLSKISSATSIRNALLNNQKVNKATPVIFKEPIFNKDLYPYIRNLLMTLPKEEISKIHLFCEGIENLLIKNAYLYDDYEEFINASISKRYTRSRIQRTLLQLALHITKKDAKINESYIRILGFNTKGKQYLASLKKKKNLNIITQFKNLPPKSKDIEWKASSIYASLLNKPSLYLKKELKGPIIID